jgi:Na+/glutamate symporter
MSGMPLPAFVGSMLIGALVDAMVSVFDPFELDELLLEQAANATTALAAAAAAVVRRTHLRPARGVENMAFLSSSLWAGTLTSR